MRKIILLGLLPFLIFGSFSCRKSQVTENAGWKSSKEYTGLQARLAKGWNTWDAVDVLSQIFLPEGFALKMDIVNGRDTVSEPHLGVNEIPGLVITPYGHAYDGSYSDMVVRWKGMNIRVQTAASGNDLVILLTTDQPADSTSLVLIPGMKWGRPGHVRIEGTVIEAEAAGKTWSVHTTAGARVISGRDNQEYLTIPLWAKVGVSVGKSLTVNEIEQIIARADQRHASLKSGYGDQAEIYDAQQSVFAWNTFYDAKNDRVFTPVSRSWCQGQGYVLFEWDTYFGGYQLSLDNKDLAYANLIAITKEITPSGFVPNFTTEKTQSSDRSQPPVGSMVLNQVYRKFGDRWILDLLFDDLLAWNRWWPEHRDTGGYLCWGSDPIPITPETSKLNRRAINKMLGAKFESGLDDSPMYDDIVYDTIRHQMKLADVGLISLYIMDCKALAEIAGILNKPAIAKELLERARKYGKSLETLWDEKAGIYLNKNLETGELNRRLSPTNFYPLLSEVPDQQKAKRMIDEHFYNPSEFWGDWIMPSIARNDPAYSNEYWRGRIWGPMNFLVYLGMRNYDLPQARADLVIKSRELLLKTFQESRMVHENYNPDTGAGTSDDYYHWGALLGFMSFLEIANE